MAVDPQEHRFLFSTGLALILISTPLGWGGIALCALIAGLTKDRAWFTAGLWVYGISWLVLGIGAAIAGRSGLSLARTFWRRRRRLSDLRRLRTERRRHRETPRTVSD